jgi:serine/threonine protein kinase
MIGKTLGHYQIPSQIGKGAMGEVFRAKDQILPREVAIHVLPEEFARMPIGLPDSNAKKKWRFRSIQSQPSPWGDPGFSFRDYMSLATGVIVNWLEELKQRVPVKQQLENRLRREPYMSKLKCHPNYQTWLG